jgi:hypothetical protein
MQRAEIRVRGRVQGLMMLINKIDLLPHADFDIARVTASVVPLAAARMDGGSRDRFRLDAPSM